ncbi:41006_t:CDS:2, partial [Gigaspora margarita]
SITGNEKYISRSVLYRIKDNKEALREIIYKGFTRSSEILIEEFKIGSIVLMIGRYVYNNNVEYVKKTNSHKDLNNQLDLIEKNFMNTVSQIKTDKSAVQESFSESTIQENSDEMVNSQNIDSNKE